ncbi:hypothetical protein F5877DRAFT_69839 [Lentinula edodes]|nr:hypothetical protein F5877DRAFT_69839 [Lentinula edodes]
MQQLLKLYIVFIFDILQTAFTTHYAWYVLAAGWGNPDTLIYTPWSLATIPPFTGITSHLEQVSSMGQCFFAWRIWILSMGDTNFLVVIFAIVLSSAGSLAAALYCGVAVGINNNSVRNHKLNTAQSLDKEVIAWLSLSAACDLIITAVLVLQLVAKRKESFTSVNHVLHRAIRMTIETGAATTMLVFVELALYLNAGTASWYFIFFSEGNILYIYSGLAIGKVYSNALLANLNSRSKEFQPSTRSLSGVHIWEVRTREISTDHALSSEDTNDRDNIELSQRGLKGEIEFLRRKTQEEKLLGAGFECTTAKAIITLLTFWAR